MRLEPRKPRKSTKSAKGFRQNEFMEFPSIEKTAVAFHAKDDVLEVRYCFFKHLALLDFQARFVVARKIERVFRNSSQAKEDAFYDHLIIHLLELSTHG